MINRRTTLRTLVGSGVLFSALPKHWSKPIIDSVIIPAHAQTSCSSISSTPFSESLSITITANEVQGPIVVVRNGSDSFAGNSASNISQCTDGSDLDVEITFSGVINSATSQISGDLVIIQRCASRLVCEQIGSYTVTQDPIDAGSDLGNYVGTVSGTLNCCDDFSGLI